MKKFKFYSIYFSIVMLFTGCTGFQTKPYSIANNDNDFMSQYCQSGKQKKAFKATVTYFLPGVDKGTALDTANGQIQSQDQDKMSILKELFYNISDEDGVAQVANQGDEPRWYSLVAANESQVLNAAKAEISTSKYWRYTFIVKIEGKNKFVVFHTNESSRRMDYDKAYSSDLKTVFSEYALLNRVNDDDENVAVGISEAIYNRETAWKDYVERFTSIKIAQGDNSKKSVAELSLDLNGFCKYGRKLSDLQAQ